MEHKIGPPVPLANNQGIYTLVVCQTRGAKNIKLSARRAGVSIVKTELERTKHRVWTKRQLDELISRSEKKWPSGTPDPFPSRKQIFESLIEEKFVDRIELRSPYGSSSRYVRSPFSPYELALSIKRGSYLSHWTALDAHELSVCEPGTIYVNKEQSPKRTGVSELQQAAVDRAFSHEPRISNYVFPGQENP